jgi:CheY-like chemotaxis protein
LDLNQVVLNICSLLSHDEHIELTTNLPPEPALVEVDPGHLDQIIMNLVLNAKDAMPSGGRLQFETRIVDLSADDASHLQVSAGEFVMLAASDNGVGMDRKTKSRLFEPFFTTKAHSKGAGLGLSFVYGIVRKLGGSVEVDSEPGRGSTFKIYLPRHLKPIDAPAKLSATSEPAIHETILLVDDERAVRRLLTMMLKRAGYRTLEAASPHAAIALVSGKNDPIDLLLTDVLMPEMKGPELAERIRALRPQLPVIFMSGYSDGALVDLPALEYSSYIQKPFTAAELSHKIRSVLGARTAGGGAT